eukprot:CAMPEP_0115399616 /NCGR_PEP_ID=MMETSP0271-20121206/14929_1 /TAXON_ID=71861 /ORGANISM="Scrippsiella trochoidea, Strain CCMP3099" /LENGTH=503 /DNA_ID=CAMNT_0002823435 /DNA_START=52 /DNA_END=1565 /DNA_ORIENTATION=+
MASPTVLGAKTPPMGPSSAEEPVLKDSEAQAPDSTDSATQLPVHVIAYRLRFMFGLIWLTTLQYGAIAPSVLYMSTTFFAGGDADCEALPDSPACQRGAADLAFWKGVSKGVSHSIAWILLLPSARGVTVTGGASAISREGSPFDLADGALALYIGFDVSLFAYLVLAPLYDTFDINGVFLAFMSDVINERQSRATAFGVLIVGVVVGAAPVFVIAALLPASIAVVVSLVVAGLKLGYIFTLFPETSHHALSDASNKPKPTIAEVVKQSFQVFRRNSFIFRMVLVLVLAGVSGAGLGAVATPVVTAYLGMQKRETTLLGFLCGCSVIASMVGLLPRLMASVGPVRSLRLCLGISAAFPVLFALCATGYQVIILCTLLVGPMFLEFPIISSIKSNLVGEDEQGLVQGALAAVRVVATAVADIFFGWFYRFATDNGTNEDRKATWWPLGAVTILGVLAFVIACTLPDKPPPPPANSQQPTGSVLSGSCKSEADKGKSPDSQVLSM